MVDILTDEAVVTAQANLEQFDSQVADLTSELSELQTQIGDQWGSSQADDAAERAAKLRVMLDSAPARRARLLECVRQARVADLKQRHAEAMAAVKAAKARLQDCERWTAEAESILKSRQDDQRAQFAEVQRVELDARQLLYALNQIGLPQDELRQL